MASVAVQQRLREQFEHLSTHINDPLHHARRCTLLKGCRVVCPTASTRIVSFRTQQYLGCYNLCPLLIYWLRSVLLSTVVIMESFDVVVTTGFFKLESFQRTFGSPAVSLNEESGYEIPSSYQSAIVNAVLAGEIVGLIMCGWLAERLGEDPPCCDHRQGGAP